MTGATMDHTLRRIRRLFSQGTATGLTDAALLGRFARGRDESAFEALVARHGPMVLGTCRGVLRDPGEAEDAFQATFLILARRAGAIRVEDSIGGWLHRVARRVAVKANVRAARRRARERPSVDPDQIPARGEGRQDDATSCLHEEIDRLPEADRRALVLCVLEGLTQVEAAEVLGCGEATVRRRLARARERLRVRLGRRGFVGPAPLAALVPRAWAEASVRVALLGASGRAVAPAVEALAGSIARGVLLRRVAVGLLAIGIGTAVVANRPGRDPEPTPPPKLVAQAPIPEPKPKPKSEDETTFLGRVLDPEGRPFAGAKVFARPRRSPSTLNATASDAEGRFRLTFDVQAHLRPGFLTEDRVDGQSWPEGQNWHDFEDWPPLIATAPGFGLGVAALGANGERVVRLVPDEPVEGRVLDIQGRPVAGASVRVRAVMAPRGKDLDPWLAAARAAGDADELIRANYQNLSLFGRHPEGLFVAYPGVLTPDKTDAEGRFHLVGIGRDRVAWLVIEGSGIESSLIAVATRAGLRSFVVPSIPARQRKSLSNPRQDLAIHGPGFDHVAGSGRSVEGVVVDRQTGSPVAGVRVVPDLSSFLEWPIENRYQAETDARGHYRVAGLPEAASARFLVKVPPDQPFLGIDRPVDAGRNLDPPTVVDFALSRGVWVEGRILDASTGRPVSGARVDYNVFPDNPHLPKPPERLADSPDIGFGGPDGRYRVAVLPGRGLLSVYAGQDGYASAAGADQVAGQEPWFDLVRYPTVPNAVYPQHIHLVAEVNPAEGSGPITLDLTLQPARTREGRAAGPEGVVAVPMLVSGLSSQMSGPFAVERGRIVVKNLSKGEERRVVVRLDDRKLIGLAVLKADEDGPFEVKLLPWATLRGKLVDGSGRPRSRGLTIKLRDDGRLPVYARGCLGYSNKPSTFPVDAEGRFLAEALLPDQPYDVEIVEGGLSVLDHAAQALVLTPGQAKDLGDVAVKSP